MNEVKLEYHSNGQLMYEHQTVNGICHGFQKGWYSNGNQYSIYFMLNGQWHGTNEYFNYRYSTRSQIIQHKNFNRHGSFIEFRYWN